MADSREEGTGSSTREDNRREGIKTPTINEYRSDKRAGAKTRAQRC